MREGRIELAAPPPFLRLFFIFFEQERKAEAALLSLGVGRVTGSSPVFRPGSLPASMETPSLAAAGGSPTSSGSDGGTSEAGVVATEVFSDDPHYMEESPPGAEGGGELPLRAEGLGPVSLSSVSGSAGSSLGGTD